MPNLISSIITGRLMRNSKSHWKLSSSTPPTSRLSAAPVVAADAQIAMAVVRCFASGNRLCTIDRVEGIRIAQATPSSMRVAMSQPAVGAKTPARTRPPQ
jgi:hypothetical protein